MVFDGSHADSNNLNGSTQPNDQTVTYSSTSGSTEDQNIQNSSFQNISHCRHIDPNAINNGYVYQTLDQRETQSTKNKDDSWHLDYLTSASSIAETLNGYEYLDDYNYCPVKYKRLKLSALKKFDLIMRSIKSSNCDLFECPSDSDSDSYLLDEPAAMVEYANFNLILKRHKKRIKTQRSNNTSHHRH